MVSVTLYGVKEQLGLKINLLRVPCVGEYIVLKDDKTYRVDVVVHTQSTEHAAICRVTPRGATKHG